MTVLSLAIAVLVLSAAGVSNAYAIGSLSRRIRVLEARRAPVAMMTPEPAPPPVRAPEPQGPFRTAGAVGDAATPEAPEPEPVGFWRELVIGEWSPLLGCLITFEMSTDNRKWTSARIYAPQRNKEAIRDTIEKFVRSVVEAQQMSATLQNGIVR